MAQSKILCPFHKIDVESKISESGWHYFDCQEPFCPLFISAEDAEPILETVKRSALMEILKGPYECLCTIPKRTKIQRVTKEGKNKGRLFLGCSKKITDKNRCDFFQWVDQPWSRVMKERREIQLKTKTYAEREEKQRYVPTEKKEEETEEEKETTPSE